MVAGCWLLVAGCWLLVAGCWFVILLEIIPFVFSTATQIIIIFACKLRSFQKKIPVSRNGGTGSRGVYLDVEGFNKAV